jgi:hypothetical protein
MPHPPLARAALVAAAITLAAPPARPQPARPAPLSAAEVAAWRADLRLLVDTLPRLHPDPFRFTPRARFDSLARDLDARLPGLARHEAVVGIIRLVASLQDGHTALNPAFDPAVGFRYLPVELYEFRDGLYVRRADPRHAALVGGRVVRIGRTPVDEALRRAGTLVSRENASWERGRRPLFLQMPEALAALGITDDMERVPLTVRTARGEVTDTLAPAGPLRPMNHGGRFTTPYPTDGWVDMRAADAPVPVWQQRPEASYFVTPVADGRTLYVAYRSCVSVPSDPIPQFFDRVLAAVDSLRPERVVIDVRENGGGESFYNRQLLLGLVRRTSVDQRGRLFAIIGRGTFSAAQNLVNELERYTNVTLVGEPTGNRPSFFGDHRLVTLPNSGLHVNVSELWWQTQDPRDRRAWVAPLVAAEPTADEYRRGADPALDAVLSFRARTPIGGALAALAAAGDERGAGARLAAYRADPANAYADAAIEAEVNAAAYRLLRDGQTTAAVALFRVNAAAFPTSANAHDSLGEGYERAGERERAVEAYRKALALDPRMAPSQAGLRRLGAAIP